MHAIRLLQAWWAARRKPLPLGKRGEAVAAKFLRRRGYKIVARAARENLGEIDLVAVDGRTVVFVEVKTRQSLDTGHPGDAVDEAKQRRLTRAALGFLKRHNLLEQSARFDVVAILWPQDERRPQIEHIQNAFEPAGEGQLYG